MYCIYLFATPKGLWRVTSHRIFTAHALQSEIAKSMGPRSPRRTQSRMRALQLPQDALQVCMKLLPCSRLHKTLVRIPRVRESDTDVPTNTAGAEGRTAPSCAQKTAT